MSRSLMSRSLKLTRPSSRRLILDSEARMVYPAAARVRPFASRRCRSCAPRRMRRAVGLLPGLAVATSLPPLSCGQYLSASPALIVCATSLRYEPGEYLHVHLSLRQHTQVPMIMPERWGVPLAHAIGTALRMPQEPTVECTYI